MTNVSNSAPLWLAADYRFAGDDWSGANALTYIVYDTAPILASDGSVLTPGVPRPLNGCSVSGTLRYMPRRGGVEAAVPVAGLPSLVGAVVDNAGLVSLSLGASATLFPRQAFDVWGDVRRALLVIQPKVTDAAGNVVTIGLQPLFVF